MPRQPRVTGKAVISALRRTGIEVVRVRGSQRFLRHADGRATVVPVHESETLSPGLLAKVLRDGDLTRDAFRTSS